MKLSVQDCDTGCDKAGLQHHRRKDLVQFNSRSTMEAGLWTGQGYSAPWMYHGAAGHYTLLEKQLDSDVSPCRYRPASRVLQDSTNWLDAQQLPPHWSLLKQEDHWFSGKELSGEVPSPKAQRQLQQHSPTYRGFPCWRDRSWGGRPASKDHSAANSKWYPGVPLAHSKSDLPARAPPSYEAHMLLRLRVGQGPRKENWPHPPPYVAPPSYEAPHLTVRPPQQQQLPPPQRYAHKDASSAGKQVLREAPRKAQARAVGVRGPLMHGPGGKARQSPAEIPGSWSYLSGAGTWSGPKMHPARAGQGESSDGLLASWDMSPQHRSHTLPRRSKPTKGVPVPHPPEHILPAGWGFSHTAAGPQAVAGKGSRVGGKQRKDLLPQWKEPGPGKESAGSQGALWKLTPRKRGGLFVIDATCVVIQAHYIPPPRMEHVRYLGLEERPDKVKVASSPRGSPGPVSMEERAARILGLSMSELGLSEAGAGKTPGIPGPKVGESHVASATVSQEAYGTGQPGGQNSALASPRKPLLAAPALSSFQVGPKEQEVPSPDDRGTTVPCQENGCGLLQGEGEPTLSTEKTSYALDLKEAMLRIRRHTAPDSDTDDDDEEEELEKDSRPPGGQPVWRGRLNDGALSYSSSSLDSSSSNATVVPRNATPTLRNGPKAGPASTARQGGLVQVGP
ncbi:dendrin isoform X2 [Pogona vitticeps]